MNESSGAYPRKTVRLERDAQVAIITLARADALNAIDDPMRTGIVEACRQAATDPEVRAVLVRAEGERAFCVGADVKESRPPATQMVSRRLEGERDYTAAIAAIAKPVIAAIHGFCLGGGLEIALACDIRLASADATFALPEVNLGLIPGAGGTQRLPRLIGMGRALHMMLSGERIDARKALDYGLLTQVTEDRDALSEAALALARSIAAKPPLALAFVKEAAERGMNEPLNLGLFLERDLFSLLLHTEDRLEALDAFRTKRQAIFNGR
jgi:enoyl-CoA hydratase/carnithine racemase